MSEGLSRRIGRPFHWREWKNYDFYSGFMSREEFAQMIVDDGMLERCQPEPGAARIMRQLKEEGLQIAILTARGFHPNAREVTLRHLELHGMPVDHLEIVEHQKGKAVPALALPNLISYVDDHVGHLDAIGKAFEQAGRDLHMSLMTRPWNEHASWHHRITSLDDFVDVTLDRLQGVQQSERRSSARP